MDLETADRSAEMLRKQIAKAEKQLTGLKEQLAKVESVIASKTTTFQEDENRGTVLLEKAETNVENGDGFNRLSINAPDNVSKWPLSAEEYKRYGRQMIVPSIGIQGQLRLKKASVLVVGAGGLGCPAATYLTGAGVGTIGIIDGDVVETSNLHRQTLHNTNTVGMKKVDSAIQYLKTLNPNLTYNAHTSHLTPSTAATIVQPYDLVIDCTDHPTSRYLISDICVLLHKTLVSASALRTDGQLIVLNSPPLPAGESNGGPCYRCVFPKPPPAESVVSCGDGGILGPVVGVMGILQALEAIKLIAGGKLAAPTRSEAETGLKNEASMLLFSSNSSPPFRTIRLRSRRKDCFACSESASLTLESLSSGSLDYVLFCGVNSPVSILQPEERISAREYSKRREENTKHVLLDVREKVQFEICNIEGSINIPFSSLQGDRELDGVLVKSWEGMDVHVVCRLGNDSQVIARKIKDSGLVGEGRWIGDVEGGLRSWRKDVDATWPEY